MHKHSSYITEVIYEFQKILGISEDVVMTVSGRQRKFEVISE